MHLFKLTLFILLLNTISVFGQTADPCRKSTEGKDFWFGFMESRTYQAPSGHKTEITITSIYTCNYEISIGKIFLTKGTIYPNTPLQIPIDWKQVEVIGSENIENKAIHLISDMPLNLYALNWSTSSADVALIFPTESLGNEYYAMCYTPNYVFSGTGPNLNSKNSEFLIVASADDTHISFTPSVVTDQKQSSGIPHSIKLNQGELYQVQSANLPNLAGQGDLTGSYITSDKPIAVFSGTYSTSVPYGVCCYDHLYEQIPPVQTWGRKFIAVPLKTRSQDYYRVIAAENGTTVRVGNKAPIPLNKGQFNEFILTAVEPSMIESNKPILLAQYCASNDVDRPPGVISSNWDGDPFMVIVSPVTQTREKVAFVAYSSAQIKSKYFINVVVKNDAAEFINLVTGTDVAPVIFTPLSDTGYSYAQVAISQGSHIIESTVPGKGFIAYVYGFGGVESYGYGVGFNLDIVLDLGSDINATDGVLVRCDGADPLTINAGNAFDHYKWSTLDTTSSIQINKAGFYSVKVSTNEGCILEDTVELKVSKPIINLGSDTTICNYANIVLDAGAKDEFTKYSWTTPQTPLTDQKITVTIPGNYAVEAKNKFGCKAKADINIDFTDRPVFSLSNFEPLICDAFITTVVPLAVKEEVTYTLTSDPKVNINDLTASVAPANFGTYPFVLTATDKFSCTSTQNFDIGFYKKPDVGFSITPDDCSDYNLNVSYHGDADPSIATFKWEYNGEIIANEIGKTSLVLPLGINRSVRDLSLTVTQNGCYKPFTLPVSVTPLLTLKSDPQLGCEPYAALFEADNTETVDYFWDYGDGTLVEKGGKSIMHTYQKAGYYDVKLKVTTIVTSGRSCSNEVKIDKMIHVAPIPDVAFSLLPDDCLEPGAKEISYTGLIGTDDDTYNWELSNFDLSEILTDPGKTKGPFRFDLKTKPLANLGLTVNSKLGCESAPGSILLKRKPDFSIAADAVAGCILFSPELSGVISDKIDVIDFVWSFGDNSTGTGSPISHTYNDPDKKYDITLKGTSTLTQCWNEISKPEFLKTYPKPKAGFSMDNKIVYNDKPTVNFTSESTGETGYLWDFGDKLTSDLKNPSHYYNVTGYRTVLLEVSNEYQCTDTVSHQLLVAMDRIFPPNAFSPNAPNAVDREFKLSSVGIATEGYHFIILSRWNDITFETRDAMKGWNGQTPNGSMASAGTYVWILNFSDFLGRRHRQTGTVTVVY